MIVELNEAQKVVFAILVKAFPDKAFTFETTWEELGLNDSDLEHLSKVCATMSGIELSAPQIRDCQNVNRWGWLVAEGLLAAGIRREFNPGEVVRFEINKDGKVFARKRKTSYSLLP